MDEMTERTAHALTRYTVVDAPSERRSWHVRDNWSKGLIPKSMSIHQHELDALKSASWLNAQNVHAALTPADLATLAEGMELMTVERNLLDALVATYAPADGSIYPEPRCMRELRAILTAGRIKPGQDEESDDDQG